MNSLGYIQGNTYKFADDTVISFRGFTNQAGTRAIEYSVAGQSMKRLHHVNSFRAAIRREEKIHGKALVIA